MKKYLRQPADFCIGIVLIILSNVVIASDVTNGAEALLKRMGQFVNNPLALPGIYVNLVAYFLLALSIMLVIRSLNLPVFAKNGKEAAEKIVVRLNPAVVVSMIALLIYMFVMPVTNFYISSTLLCTVISFAFGVKEKHLDLKDRKAVLRAAFFALLYSAIAVGVLQFIFATFFNVIFP